MVSVWFELILVFITFIIFIGIWFKRQYSYWQHKGIPYVEPIFPYGLLKGVGADESFGELLARVYIENKNKNDIGFVGAYFLWKPVIIVTDVNLMKNMLIKDFNSFHDRNFYYNEKDDPISAHLFSLDGQKWKILRSKLTPTFTTGKMKYMFPTVVNVAEKFKYTLGNLILDNSIIELKDLLARYTTDVIGSCAFGIECNSLKNPNAEFRKYGKKMFEKPRHSELVRLIMNTYPNVARFFHIKQENDDVSKFFMDAVRETIDFREKNNIRRNDFMDLLIQLKNKGKIDDSETSNNVFGNLTYEEIAAQAYLFFAAGFETSSTTLGFCFYELCINQDVQDKARDEINEVMSKYDGNLTYEGMMEMTYVHQVIDETLRKYPPGTLTGRRCTKNYNIPGKSVTIENGIDCYFPIYGVHHDPEYYPDPLNFDPERFNPDVVKERHSITYLPFGEGPRNCIGLRFGKMQTYVGLIVLLKNFKFYPSDELQIPLTYKKDAFILTSNGGLWLKVEALI